jgi:rSAM/selenodomain-associated transferase 1
MTQSHAILDPAAPPARARRTCALAIMAKAPRVRLSKTRLVPPLSHEESAALSACFLRDTAENINAACVALEGAAEGVAAYTPVGAESAFAPLLPHNFALLAQRGDDFGARLSNAATDLLALGYDSLCLIGSDSPTLPTRTLIAAVEELSKLGDRLVLGCADDGGYYLIGIKAVHPRLFAEIDWSTSRVSAQTVARAQEINLPVVLLPAWYDVDAAATLARLCEELFAPPRPAPCIAPRPASHTSSDDDRDNDDRATIPVGHVTTLASYDAPHTRDFLARLIAREGRARIWRDDATTGTTDNCHVRVAVDAEASS